MTLYKTLNGTAGAYGYGCWSLPTTNPDGTYTPGEWMPPVKPALCKSGYHACRDLYEVWVHLGLQIYELEPADLETTMRIARECGTEWDPSWPIVYEGDNKIVYACARLTRRLWADTWTPEAQALYVVDCARMVAHLRGDPELAHACLDVTVAGVLYGEEWKAGLLMAQQLAFTPVIWHATRGHFAALWYATQSVPRMVRSVLDDAQVALLERYLAGEQGPLVDGVRA
jgi:hypothetical protein